MGTASTVTPADATAKLSDDKTTLTIVAKDNETFNGSYEIKVDGTKVSGINGETMSDYDQVLTFKDTVRPTIAAPTYPANKVAQFKFSEPLLGGVANSYALATTDIESAMTITDSTGKVISSTGKIKAVDNTNKTFSLDLNSADFTIGKAYNVTFNALSDFAGNLITPNPVTYQVTVKSDDTTAPTVQSIVAVQPGKMKITFSEPVSQTAVPLAYGYKINGTLVPFDFTTSANHGYTTVDSTGTVFTVSDSNLTGIKGITVTGYNDLSNNPGDDVTKTINFGADTTAPTLVSSQVTTIGTTQYLIANFSENVNVPAPGAGVPTYVLSGSYVDANSITHSSINVGLGNATPYNVDVNGNSKSVKIELNDGSVLPNGTYSMKLQAGSIVDLSSNAVAQTAVNFTIGTAAPTTAPKVLDYDNDSSNGYTKNVAGDPSIVASTNTDPKTVDISFDQPLSASTALNAANYTVEGQQIFSSAVFDGDNQTVKLTLKSGAITLTGARQLSIANVTNASGIAMVPVATNVNFTENVAPTVKSAILSSASTITVKFSEAVSADATADFNVYVNGQKVAITSQTAAVATNGDDSVTITLTSPLTDLTSPVKINVVPGNDVVDGAGNALSTTGDFTVTE